MKNTTLLHPGVMVENFKMVLKSLSEFDDDELGRIIRYFKPKSVKKKDILVHEGSVCKDFYYVSSGCIRTYFIDRKGSEKTRYVLLDHHVGTAMTSFISQKPSAEFVDVLEDSELLSINHSDFYRLNKEIKSWNFFYQKTLEMAYSFQNRKIERLVSLTAKQRFEKLKEEQPQLIQRLSNRVLATYLDIREETLSRLKNR